MLTIRNVASFVRWRLVPVRYATRLVNFRRPRRRAAAAACSAVSKVVATVGHHPGPRFADELVAAINAIYRPRTADVVERPGHPFVNLVRAEDFSLGNPLMRLAFGREVLDAATNYFGGSCTLDSIQVLYSWPTSGGLAESQMWHKDYGDSKSFHCIVYLNDVISAEDGPFVYVDRRDTRRIGKAPIIRRIADDRFTKELGDGEVRSFYGLAGESVFIDPAVCYHYGSRCRNGRLAIFVTLNSSFPFVPPQRLISDNASKLYEIAREIRPDLDDDFLRDLLRLPN